MLRALLWFACAAAPPPVEESPPPASVADPAALYAACRERVEGPSAPGECVNDADCAPTGCSREVCAKAGLEWMTACDVEPCFAVLDRCGCVDGVCSWSVR